MGSEQKRLQVILWIAFLLGVVCYPTALALIGLFAAENAFAAAIVAGAMTVDAARGSSSPFDAPCMRCEGSAENTRPVARPDASKVWQ